MFPDANYSIPFSLFVNGWGPLGRERNDGCGKVWVCDQSVSEDTVHREMGAAEKDWLISIDLVASKLANDDINDDINDLSSTKTDNGWGSHAKTCLLEGFIVTFGMEPHRNVWSHQLETRASVRLLESSAVRLHLPGYPRPIMSCRVLWLLWDHKWKVALGLGYQWTHFKHVKLTWFEENSGKIPSTALKKNISRSYKSIFFIPIHLFRPLHPSLAWFELWRSQAMW